MLAIDSDGILASKQAFRNCNRKGLLILRHGTVEQVFVA